MAPPVVSQLLLGSLPPFFSAATFFTVAALAAGVFMLYFYAPSWRVRKVPGPLALPLIGHLPLFAKHGLELFDVLAKRYGPIYRFHMGRQPLIMVANPELCREVGIKKFKSIHSRSVPAPVRSSPIYHKGLFFVRILRTTMRWMGAALDGSLRFARGDHSRWQSMRNAITSVYQPSHLASLIPSIQPYIERAGSLLRLRGGVEITFSDLSLKLFIDTIGQIAFGVDFGLTRETTPSPPHDHPVGADRAESVDAATDLTRHVFYTATSNKLDLTGSLSTLVGMVAPLLQGPVRQLLLRVPGSADRRAEEANDTLCGLLGSVVAEREAQADRGHRNFLSVVLNARESTESMRKLLTLDCVGGLTYDHLIAGSVTSSFTLSSLVYLVAMHPEVEEKLLREIDAFGPKDVLPSYEDLETKFPYLDQVLKEAMRFYMASPLIAREVSEDVEIGGYVLPKGTWVWLAPGVLAKDPKQFPDPDMFRPERFDPESEECKRRHPYAFIPFGIGPRSCIGKKLAEQQLKLVVVHLYRHYVFRHSPNMEFPLQFQFSMLLNFKHGVKLQVIERKT